MDTALNCSQNQFKKEDDGNIKILLGFWWDRKWPIETVIYSFLMLLELISIYNKSGTDTNG